MTAKTFEVRDRATFIPVLAVRLDSETERERYLFARAGYGLQPWDQQRYVLLLRLPSGEGRFQCDPVGWGDRTMQVAHGFIAHKFEQLESGAVIDVEHILGERQEPKRSEAEEAPL